MPKDLKTSIGDINIAFEGDIQRCGWDIPPAYWPFMGSGKPHIRLRLHTRELPISDRQKIFECSPIWTLFRRKKQSVIKIFEKLSVPGTTLVFPDDIQAADLYPNDKEGFPADPFYGPVLELLMVNYLARGMGAIIHACGISNNDSGVLFVGESGAGKSTVARLWDQQKDVKVLSDDRTIVREKDGRLQMYGTPWHGEAKFGSPGRVKLEGIFFLRHGSQNAIKEVTGTQAVTQFLKCSFPPLWDNQGMEFTMDFFTNLAAKVPCWDLFFKPDESVVEYIKAQGVMGKGIGY